VSCALKGALGGEAGAQKLSETVHAFNSAAQQCAAASERIDRLFAANESNLTGALCDARAILTELKERVPAVFETTIRPAREIVNNLKGFFSKFNTFFCIVDGHIEALCKIHNCAGIANGKGYLNFRLHPMEDYFCLVGVTASFRGRMFQYEENRKWYECTGRQLVPANMALSNGDTLDYAPRKYTAMRKFNALSLNLQLGKIFRNSALRVGLFEGSGGIAVDWDVPLGADWVRWISTFELFDIRGQNRFNDSRPHLKWLNKLYFMNELYITLGADDFISKYDKTFLFGAGVRVAF
jgi:hypothetical protein